MIVAAVPVKDLVNAKQRLRTALDPTQRRRLAGAMLADVLGALVAARLDAVWVVTRDPEVRAMAREAGADVLAEVDNRGHTAAVALAQAEAARRRVRVFLTVPGDVPCATPGEVAALVAAAAAPPPVAVFVSSRSGRGTNGVALNPADAMPLTFGEPSFDDHLVAARGRGLALRVLELRGLGLDVDDPEDLRALLAEGGATESGRLLARWSLASHRKGGEASLRG
jgi:2-phospho-L-lactate guanylyltransferase